jgi:hypothetical protein
VYNAYRALDKGKNIMAELDKETVGRSGGEDGAEQTAALLRFTERGGRIGAELGSAPLHPELDPEITEASHAWQRAAQLQRGRLRRMRIAKAVPGLADRRFNNY